MGIRNPKELDHHHPGGDPADLCRRSPQGTRKGDPVDLCGRSPQGGDPADFQRICVEKGPKINSGGCVLVKIRRVRPNTPDLHQNTSAGVDFWTLFHTNPLEIRRISPLGAPPAQIHRIPLPGALGAPPAQIRRISPWVVVVQLFRISNAH